MASPLLFGAVQLTFSWLWLPTEPAPETLGAAGVAGTPAGVSAAE